MRKLALALLAAAIPYQAPADDNELPGRTSWSANNAKSLIQVRL